jgi:hypothetical protein
MTSAETKSEFTIRSANRTLPLVKMIVQDIVGLSKEVNETRERLEYLSEGRETEHQDEYAKELASIEQVTDLQYAQIDGWIQELKKLQVLPHSASDGFVDFPALRNGEPVCLCWQLGDKEVVYWHRQDQECSKRQPVDLPMIRQSGDRSMSSSA